jgi:hypothetical protein
VERQRDFIVAGIAVYIPVGLIEALDLTHFDVGHIDVVGLIALAAVTVLFIVLMLGGEVLYSGIVAAITREHRGGEARSLAHLARSLPYGRLIAADVLFVIMVAVGFVALVVPGLVLLAWFSLVAPAIEIERLGLIDGFRRSRTLVRRSFGRSLVIILAATLASEALARGIYELFGGALGHSFLARWLESTVSGLITGPLFAVPIVVLYFELADADAAAAEAAATSSGTVTKA